MCLYVLLKQDTGLAKNVLLGNKVGPGLTTGQQTLAASSPLPIQVHCLRPLIESGGLLHCHCLHLHQARQWESPGMTGEKG